MAENLNIRINASISDLQGQTALLRQIQQLRDALGTTPGQPGFNIRVHLIPGDVAALERARQQRREQSENLRIQRDQEQVDQRRQRFQSQQARDAELMAQRRQRFEGVQESQRIRQAQQAERFQAWQATQQERQERRAAQEAARASRPISQAELNAQAASLFGFGAGIPGAQGPGVTEQAVSQAGSLIGNPRAVGGPPPLPPSWWSQLRGSFGGGGGAGGGVGGGTGGGGAGGGGLLGALAPLSRLFGRVGMLGVGLTAWQMATQAMDVYEERNLGILDTGRQLDLQYKQLDQSLSYLGRRYQVTSREGIAAISSLGQVTGTVAGAVAGATQAIGVGRAYGMTPEAAVGVQTQLTLYGPGGQPNLANLAGVYEQARARGELQRMSFGRFAGEVAGIAGVGGLGAQPLSETQAGRYGEFMAQTGPRYEANPAAAFQQYYAGQQGQKSEIGDTLNWMAVARVMREHPEGIRWGNRVLQPRGSWIDQQILMSEGAHIPAYQQAQFQEAQRMAGGNRQLAMSYFGQMTGTTSPADTLQRFEVMERRMAQPGGHVGLMEAAPPTGAGEAAVAARERQPYQPGQDIRERRMLPEELAQTGIIKWLEDAQTQIQKTVLNMAQAFNTTEDATKLLGDAFKSLILDVDKLKAALDPLGIFKGITGLLPPWGRAAPSEEEAEKGLIDFWSRKLGIPPHELVPGTQPRTTQ